MSEASRSGRRIRVLHFAQDGDTSGFFPQLAKHHDRSRYEMLFGTLKPIASWLLEYMESQGIGCVSCNGHTRAEYPAAALRLARFLRSKRIDILHTHLFEPSAVGLVTGALAGTSPRVMTRHYSDYHTRIDKRWHVRVDQLCSRLSDRVIAVSQHTADHMVEREGAPRSKIRVVLNGIDFDRVREPEASARDAIRREWAPAGEPLLVCVGRLHPEKGYEILFEAMSQVARDLDGRVRLLVLGEGPFAEEYRRRVSQLGLDQLVHFLGFRRDAPAYIAAADVFVLASVAEAFGLVLAEAVYLGTPVVATRVGGIPEIVDDGRDGRLVPASDPGALASALTSLCRDPALRRSLSGAGRAKVLERFRFARMVAQYEDIYRELLP